ncbi:hypothetical protein EMIT0P4_90172 [Pseudomonas sp. IT-P4]
MIQAAEQAQAERHGQHAGGHRIAQHRTRFFQHRRSFTQGLQTRGRHQVGGTPQALEHFEFVAVLGVLVQPELKPVPHFDIHNRLLQTHKPLRRVIANRCLPARTITSIHHGSSCLAGEENSRRILV